MRVILVVLALAIGILAAFFGLRVGYLSLTPTWMYNAQGVNSYTYRTYDPSGRIILTGTCDTHSGRATFRVYAPNGAYVAGQECIPGRYGINLQAGGEVGLYRLEVTLEHYTGHLDLIEQRAGQP